MPLYRSYSIAALVVICCACLFLMGCVRPTEEVVFPPLTSINIIDRNGFSETISTPDRLKNYDNVNFQSNQPYQKVLRVYGKDGMGDVYSYITSYHPNGQLHQYLEVVNGRALGTYQEWHANGTLSIEAKVIGGSADITPGAQKGWLFDGLNSAWDESGNLIAEFQYDKGSLEGTALYYHPSGSIWKKEPYCNNQLQGTVETYLDCGQLLQTTEYVNGIKHGISKRYWEPDMPAAEEQYINGLLIMGSYYDRLGQPVAEVVNGNGYRAVFGRSGVAELQEFRQGIQQGEIKLFNGAGRLVGSYNSKDGIKHGLEIEYYNDSFSVEPKPKLSIQWSEGKMQGMVKTWYSNGLQESQREMSANNKNGLLTAWYADGSLMMIEEYDKDKLVKGEYFRKGDRIPVSRIMQGKGTATLFDQDGNFLRKLEYYNSRPMD